MTAIERPSGIHKWKIQQSVNNRSKNGTNCLNNESEIDIASKHESNRDVTGAEEILQNDPPTDNEDCKLCVCTSIDKRTVKTCTPQAEVRAVSQFGTYRLIKMVPADKGNGTATVGTAT